MFSKINSFSTRGIDGYRITVEVDVSNGLPSFVMVGYLAEEVREAQERAFGPHFGMRGFACRRSGSRSIYRQPGCGKRERGVIWRSRQEF
ncbi:MAG: hypothetical protein ACLSH1_07420 [Clostridia bacterium]